MTNNLNSNPGRRGVTAAGLGGLALASVLLLCGAGNAPIENFLPQGAMQADLNAGGHSVTNAATVSATNVTASGELTATNAVSANPWTINQDAQSLLFLGDSITYGSTMVQQGTACSALLSVSPFYAGHIVHYSTAGTVTYNTTLTITGPTTGIAVDQQVSGTGILFGTRVSAVSGSTVTLSQGAANGAISNLVFWNAINIASPGYTVAQELTAFNSYGIAHRPTVNGGDGGVKTTAFLLVGTNDIAGGQTDAQTIASLTSLTTTLQANGIYVVLQTILPRDNGTYAWTAQDEIYRQNVNRAILNRQIPCDMVADTASILPDPANNGVTPTFDVWEIVLSGTYTGGTFTITDTTDGITSYPIPYNATAAQVVAAWPVSGWLANGTSAPTFYLSPPGCGHKAFTVNTSGLTGGTASAATSYPQTGIGPEVYNLDHLHLEELGHRIWAQFLLGCLTRDGASAPSDPAVMQASFHARQNGQVDGALSAGGFGYAAPVVLTTATTLAVNTDYEWNGTTNLTETLPATAAVGSRITLLGNGAAAGLMTLSKASGQAIYDGSGTAYSTMAQGASAACVTLVCTVANTTWSVESKSGSFADTP